MRKLIQRIFNHEMWIDCKNCLLSYDLRRHGFTCPECKHNNKK